MGDEQGVMCLSWAQIDQLSTGVGAPTAASGDGDELAWPPRAS